MNYLTINVDIRNYTNVLALHTPDRVFICNVKDLGRISPGVQINDEDLIKLRDFLNEVTGLPK